MLTSLVSIASFSFLTERSIALQNKGKRKGNVDLYSESPRTPLTRSDMDHAVLPANNTISDFTCKHFPGGASAHIRISKAWVQLTTHLSTPRGWMAELALAMLADIHVQRTYTADSLPRGGHPSTARHDAGQKSHSPTFIPTVLRHQNNRWLLRSSSPYMTSYYSD